MEGKKRKKRENNNNNVLRSLYSLIDLRTIESGHLSEPRSQSEGGVARSRIARAFAPASGKFPLSTHSAGCGLGLACQSIPFRSRRLVHLPFFRQSHWLLLFFKPPETRIESALTPQRSFVIATLYLTHHTKIVGGGTVPRSRD